MAGAGRDVTIGQNVMTLRGALSQQALADEMRALGHRWSQSTVWSVERGDRPVKLNEAIDLARILNCAVEKLWAEPAVVHADKILHHHYLSVDDHLSELENAAVRFEHRLRAARNMLDHFAEQGIQTGWANMLDDFPPSASEAVRQDRLKMAWRRLSGDEFALIPGVDDKREVQDGEHHEAP